MSARHYLTVATVAGVILLAQARRVFFGCSPAPSRMRTRRSPNRHPGRTSRRRSTIRSELAVTVYNSDIALVRDVRNLQLPRGTFDLQFMDIAATVNPATVHFRSLTEPSRVERPRAELRVRPARAGQAAAQVRRPRRHAGAARAENGDDARGRSEGAAPQLQQRAGLADRRRDRHRPAAPITSAFPSCPATSTRARR